MAIRGSLLADLLEQLTGESLTRFLDRTERTPLAFFRLNPLKHSLEFQLELLHAEGFAPQPAWGIPLAYHSGPGDPPPGKSLSHFLGHIYIQDLASMLSPILLEPRPGEHVLDLCSAPGSKTTQMAAMMQNRGVILANDSSRRRIRTLIFNLRRMGVQNAAVFQWFGQEFGNQYFESFDRVLLDAPCSALGTFLKNPEVCHWWTPERSRKLATNQKSLLLSGLKALRPGGRLLYSTCTLSPEENEAVLDDALSSFPVELEPITPPAGLTFRPGVAAFDSRRFDTSVRHCLRLYPHENPCEGFFFARLRKLESFGQSRLGRIRERTDPFVSPEDSQLRRVEQFLDRHFGLNVEDGRNRFLRIVGSELAYAASDFRGFPLLDKPVRIGLPVAHLRRWPPKLTTEGSHLLGGAASRNVVLLEAERELESFVNRRDLPSERTGSHQVLVSFKGQVLGHALLDNSTLISRFPRAGWKFKICR